MDTGKPALFGPFQLEAKVGEGGMAEVFKARWMRGPRAGEAVAVKRLLPHVAEDVNALDLFLSEADLGRYLQHSNIVQAQDSGCIDDIYYIAMEFIDGPDLGQITNACKTLNVRMPIDLACYIVRCVAEALHFAHTLTGVEGRPLGIIHCDVTPSNIFISSRGDVKLADFGIAHNTVVGSTYDSGMAGKPHYFAPEQILGEPLAPGTDIYSLGVVFFEMLTNQRPLTAETVAGLCDLILENKIALPSSLRPDISDRLDEVVLTMMARRLPNRADSYMNQLRALVTSGHVRYDAADLLVADLEGTYDPAVGSSRALVALSRGLLGAR